MSKRILEKQWVCMDRDCDYRVIQENKPDHCPECLKRDGEDAMHWLEFVYKCPYCDVWMCPNSPDEGWVECNVCGLNFETEFHESIIRDIHKHLGFFIRRTQGLKVGYRMKYVGRCPECGEHKYEQVPDDGSEYP